MSVADPAPGRLALGHAMGLFVALSFGSAYPVAKPIVAAVDPVLFSCARYLIAGTLMLALLGLRGVHAVAVPWRELPLLIVLGVLGYTLFQGLWGVALSMTTPGKAVVVVATTPIFGALFGALAGERLSVRGWIGVGLAFAGVFLVVNGSVTAFTLGGGALAGDALFLCLAALWAAYGALSRPCVLRLGALRTTGWSAVLGAGLLVPLAVPGAMAQDWRAVDPTMVLGFAHTAVIIGCFGLTAWSGGLARLGLARISAYLYLAPVVGISLSGLLLGEWLSPVQVAGAGAVLAGVALTQVFGHR